MKTLFDLIVSIPKDKLLHIIAGMIVALIAIRLSVLLIGSWWIIRLIGLSASILAGLGREIQNKVQGSKFDIMDWLATIAGGAIVSLVSPI